VVTIENFSSPLSSLPRVSGKKDFFFNIPSMVTQLKNINFIVLLIKNPWKSDLKKILIFFDDLE
jgi:hypothetical protein